MSEICFGRFVTLGRSSPVPKLLAAAIFICVHHLRFYRSHLTQSKAEAGGYIISFAGVWS